MNLVQYFRIKKQLNFTKTLLDPSKIEFENEKKNRKFIYVRNQIQNLLFGFADKFFPDR